MGQWIPINAKLDWDQGSLEATSKPWAHCPVITVAERYLEHEEAHNSAAVGGSCIFRVATEGGVVGSLQ